MPNPTEPADAAIERATQAWFESYMANYSEHQDLAQEFREDWERMTLQERQEEMQRNQGRVADLPAIEEELQAQGHPHGQDGQDEEEEKRQEEDSEDEEEREEEREREEEESEESQHSE